MFKIYEYLQVIITLVIVVKILGQKLDLKVKIIARNEGNHFSI